MTYCCALRLEQGMLFISDTRTNAGVDHISVFRKLYTFGIPGERMIVIQASGNLATTSRNWAYQKSAGVEAGTQYTQSAYHV